jgi:flagellar hook assembly protein FlgD
MICRLGQNDPDPFDAETTIPYALLRRSHVTLEIIDGRRQRVRLLVEDVQQPGDHTVQWDGRNGSGSRVSTGLYWCRLTVRTPGGRAFICSRQMQVAT